jgi:hypothetical protein
MLSQRRPGLVYTNTGPEVREHDEDIDADLVKIDQRSVYLGSFDPAYEDNKLDVQWMYDDLTQCCGLVEYETNNREEFSVLWFYENPYSTFFQEPNWICENKTVWSLMSNEAYQDCLDSDFKHVVNMSLYGNTRLFVPSMLIDTPKEIYECTECGCRNLSVPSGCHALKKLPFPSCILFLDDSFVVYTPPKNSAIWSRVGVQLPHDDAQVPLLEQAEVPPPPEEFPAAE